MLVIIADQTHFFVPNNVLLILKTKKYSCVCFLQQSWLLNYQKIKLV